MAFAEFPSRTRDANYKASRSGLLIPANSQSKTFSTQFTSLNEAIAQYSSGTINRDAALEIPTILRARDLICSIATLPLVCQDRDRNVIDVSLLAQIDPDIPNLVTLAQTVEDLIFDAESWWKVTAFGWDGYPVSAHRVEPCSVMVVPTGKRSLAPLPSGIDPRHQIPGASPAENARVYIDGIETDWSELIRFDSPNRARSKVLSRTIRRAILLYRLAEMYADDPRPLDYFEPSDNFDSEDHTTEEIVDIINQWKAARKQRATGYVPSWLKWNVVAQPSAADSQVVPLMQQVNLDLAVALGMDPEDVGLNVTSRTYFNAQDRRQSRINDVLNPYMMAITGRLSMKDVTKRGQRVKFDLDDYMKTDPASRVAYYQALVDMGAIDAAEVRAEEGWAGPPPAKPATPEPTPVPVPVPAPMDVATGAAGSDPTNAPTPVEGAPMAQALAQSAQPPSILVGQLHTFHKSSGPTVHSVPLALHSFSVDTDARTITGIAVPYGTKQGNGYRFEKGALRFSDPSQVKLWERHDPDNNPMHPYDLPIGVMLEARDTSRGFETKFRVANTPEGDRALALADVKALHGLSVEVFFDERRDTIPDPFNRAGRLILRSDLTGVALSHDPAFADSRVTGVKFDKKGNPVEDEIVESPAVETPETDPAQPTTGPTQAQFSAEQIQHMLAVNPDLAQVFSQTLTQPAPRSTQAAPLTAEQIVALRGVPGGEQIIAASFGVRPEPRPVVNPTRQPATTQVREAAPYRFNRQGELAKGTHSFSQDVFAATNQGGDPLEAAAAGKRLLAFMRAQFADDPIADSELAALNPTITNARPYVDERDYATPFWTRCGRGELPNMGQPFSWPKFGSSAITVATHVEGTDPDATDYVTSTQTVTPVDKVAKVQIPLKSWLQGGNPALDGLIWRKILRAWAEHRESVADAALDAYESSPGLTDLATFTAGGGTDKRTLAAEMEAGLALLHFARGGARFGFVATQADLFAALVAAKDSAGRALYPQQFPQNANGQVAPGFGYVTVGGIQFLPNIAGAASGQTTAVASYLIDPLAVDLWASGPIRVDIRTQLSYIEIGVVGSMAAAVNDAAGVRTISYDPTA